jgi:hypothetical protein
MGAINRSDKIATTLYPLGTWFVSGICVNTLHKGDSDDDDDNNNNPNKTEFGTRVTHPYNNFFGSVLKSWLCLSMKGL